MNDIIKKSNDMIAKFRYKLSKPQTRLIHYFIGKLRVEDLAFQTYDLPVAEILALTGMSSQGAYNKIKTTARDLMKKVFTFEEILEGEQVQKTFAWFSFIQYVKGSGAIQVRFDPGLKPYLLQLKSNFTTYPLEYALAMRPNSTRVYEFLKQASVFKNSKYFDLEDFKRQLQIDEIPTYKEYGSLKRRILLRAKREISAITDIKIIKIVDDKKGTRKVQGFTVFFKAQVPPEEKAKEEVKAEVLAEVLKSLESSATYDEILENFDPDPIIFPEPQK